MSVELGSGVREGPARAVSLSRLTWFASIVFCGALPVATVVTLFATTWRDDTVAFDFRPFYAAGEALVRGDSPYPGPDDPLSANAGPYVYPPLPALVTVLLTPLPREVAGLLVMGVLLLAAFATLRVLDVRDWRCYGVVLLWPPVLSAIQTGNVTLLLGLGAALAWRYRDRALASAAAVGVSLAVKFFLWPLVVWLASVRKYSAVALAFVLGVVLLIGSWAAIGFDGLTSYPGLLRRLEDTVGDDSYTAYIVALDLGLPPEGARLLWLLLGGALLAAVVMVGRAGDERTAFLLAIAAALALTPIVWLHYFALLLVVVAVARPTLALVWFVPLGMLVTPGSGHPTPFETAATLFVAAFTFALALVATRREQPADAGLGEAAARGAS